MKTPKQKELDSLVLLNVECFGVDDDFSSIEAMSQFVAYNGGEYILSKTGRGYLMFQEHPDHIEGVRMGVTEEDRRKGIGLNLIKAVIKIAHFRNKPFKTYVSLSNIPSLNAHIKSGMLVDYIDSWVHVKSTPNQKR